MKYLVLLAALFLAIPANASQNTLVIPNTGTVSGLTLVNTTNSAFNTLVTNSSGASAPSPAYAYQQWVDTANSLLKFTPDATNWYPMGSYSGSQWAAISNGVPLTIPSSTGSSNAFVITYSPVPTAYVTGQHYPFIANFSNTGAATVNVNSLGAKSIKKNGATALASGDIASGQVVDEVYDGTNMQMVAPTSVALPAPGTTGNVLTSNGSIWTSTAASGGGAMTLLATVNASGASTVVFNSTYITNTYNKYVVEIDSLASGANAGPLQVVFSTDNGSTYLSTGYGWVITSAGGSTMTVASNSSDSKLKLGSTSINTSPYLDQQATMTFSGLARSQRASVMGKVWAGESNLDTFAGYNSGTTAINNIKFTIPSDVVTANVHLYGLSGN